MTGRPARKCQPAVSAFSLSVLLGKVSGPFRPAGKDCRAAGPIGAAG